jgi:hypothetical protein
MVQVLIAPVTYILRQRVDPKNGVIARNSEFPKGLRGNNKL